MKYVWEINGDNANLFTDGRIDRNDPVVIGNVHESLGTYLQSIYGVSAASITPFGISLSKGRLFAWGPIQEAVIKALTTGWREMEDDTPETESETDADVERDWREFWIPIIAPYGVVLIEQVKRELYDYHRVMRNCSRAYCWMTNDRIGKQLTDFETVEAIAGDIRTAEIEDATKDCETTLAAANQDIERYVVALRKTLEFGEEESYNPNHFVLIIRQILAIAKTALEQP